MDETLLLYWVGYFTATGVILCIGLFAWALVLNVIYGLLNRTYTVFNEVYLISAAMQYLKKGEIKDRHDNWWKITVSEDKKKITLEEVDVSEW
jgi:hypothetical protein